MVNAVMEISTKLSGSDLAVGGEVVLKSSGL